jgi:hypothetical protein
MGIIRRVSCKAPLPCLIWAEQKEVIITLAMACIKKGANRVGTMRYGDGDKYCGDYRYGGEI